MESKKTKETLVNYENVENTPFTLVEKDKKFALLIGNTLVSEWVTTKKKALEMTEIKNMEWSTLTTMIITLVEKFEEIKQLKS